MNIPHRSALSSQEWIIANQISCESTDVPCEKGILASPESLTPYLPATATALLRRVLLERVVDANRYGATLRAWACHAPTALLSP